MGEVLDPLTGAAVAAFLTLLTPATRIYQVEAVPLDWPGYGLLILTGLSLSIRRRWPLAMYVVGVGSATVYLGARYPGWPVYVGAGLVLVAYASAGGWAAWPLTMVGGVALGIASGRPEGWQPARMLTVFGVWLALGGFTAHATELRRRRAEEVARHRVVEERLRIAREMHDILSHGLATISLQSGAALRRFPTRPAEAEAALRTIRRVSNDALAQARAVLTSIRDPVEPAATGSDDLDALFESVRSTGLTVKTTVALSGGVVPRAIAPIVYRVIQESLTNVMRHAGPKAEATVAIARHADAIVVEVADRGGAARPGKPGHGLLGMRERVLEAGGDFSAGPEPAGGFRVRVRLPLGSGTP
ncbi:MAG TPA: sensor histidine kinase [Candidatus Dormibacteraeota bacterium]|nr:sensor histidine kinase [Candidatus Dormibacteraeota bacterium]